MSSKTRQQLEAWVLDLPRIESDQWVLDVGGSQSPVNDRILHEDRATFKILDLKNPHENHAAPDIIQDLNEPMDQETMKWKRSFHVAFCLEVSEYWWNPVHALQMIADLMKQDALLYISFHFVYPVHNPSGCDYLRYTRDGAIRILNEAGFSVEEVTPRYGDPRALAQFIKEEGMRPAKEADLSEVGCLIKAKKL